MTARPFLFSINDAMNVAAKKAGIDGWQAYRWRALDNGPRSDSLVIGCVPDGFYTRGDRKGRPRFSKPKPGTVRELAVTHAELISYAETYVRETGRCWDCKGEGRTLAGAGLQDDGSIYRNYRTCTRCGGSCIDPTAEARAA